MLRMRSAGSTLAAVAAWWLAWAPATPPAAAPPCLSPAAHARTVLFPDGVPAEPGCADGEDEVRCLVAVRFAADPAARDLALALYDEVGDLAGVEQEFEMDGGFRGRIHIVPEPPLGTHRKHLSWVLGAQRDIATFLETLQGRAEHPLGYHHAPLDWRFFRSVDRTTPSAYAQDWEIAYNVSGSLNRSASSVRELIFHELFHLNDEAHGGWSRPTLGTIVDAVAARCGTDVDCLAPYAPGTTRVRGGTYYAFQPDNGDIAREYAAELAVRYFVEHRAVLAGEPLPAAPFRCGPPENRETWTALADEFFGGVDLVPACP